MRKLRLSIAFVVTACMVGAVAWAFGWPLERAIYLAPVIVVGFAAAAGLLIL